MQGDCFKGQNREKLDHKMTKKIDIFGKKKKGNQARKGLQIKHTKKIALI